ncbi:MAG TPA: hypothetical protein VFO34_10125 [Candidatus Acidoferrales bacterium]|nr:hypothetical protein [Candidatus Acidoferrales bacterium]
MSGHPPQFAARLLYFLLPATERDAILGDLEEEFAAENRLSLWYWTQAMESIVFLIWRPLVRQGLGILTGGAVMAVALVLTQTGAKLVLPKLPHWQPLEFAFTLAVVGFGAIAASCAGYLTACLTGGGLLRNTILLGMLLIGISAYWLRTIAGSSAPMWYRGALMVLILPAALIGGHRRARHELMLARSGVGGRKSSLNGN